ncbi:MAG: hypothetical protein AAFN30_08310 [Actinomycetota bacterium]
MTEHAPQDEAAATAFAEGAGGAWIERDVIEAVGPDTVEYLQGQLSQNVETLAEGQSRWTLLLQPQGKIDAHLRMTRVGPDRVLLDVEPGHGAAALARLERFKLRVDCQLTLSTMSTLAVRGPAAADGPDALGIAVDADAVVVDALWAGVAGFDVLGQPPGPAGIVTLGSATALDALRIRLGLPAMGAELGESTIPAAAGIVDDAVDFTKGCYVGQELVARIDSRGSNTPTHLRRVHIDVPDAAAGPAPGAAVVVDGGQVGALTSVAATPEGGWDALAFIKRTVDVPAEATVEGGDGPLSARLSALR